MERLLHVFSNTFSFLSQVFKKRTSVRTFTEETRENVANPGNYPCLCVTLNPLLRLTRLTGILPIRGSHGIQHGSGCRFSICRNWIIYSTLLLVIYFTYCIVLYAFRLNFGPNETNHSDWYVMTIGYVMTDLDSLVTILMGIIKAREICGILEKLNKIPGKGNEASLLNKQIKLCIISLLFFLIMMQCSYIYVVKIRQVLKLQPIWSLQNILDSPQAVVIRGVSVVFSTVQLAVVFTLCCLIWMKFEYLSELIANTLERNQRAVPSASTTAFTNTVMMDMKTNENFYSVPLIKRDELNQFFDCHKKIWDCLQQVNECVGLQLFIAVSSSLFTAIYYLYRYGTATNASYTSNPHEKFHYVIGFAYRSLKMLFYVYTGSKIYNYIQTLILQWQGKNGYLSALGVFNMGLWLLAPIVGNVITYLLVALQFDSSYSKTSNSSYNVMH